MTEQSFAAWRRAERLVQWAGSNPRRLMVLELLRPLPMGRRIKNAAYHWSRS